MKPFDEQEFISDLDTLPLNIYSSDDPEEQLEYFNSMFKGCLEKGANYETASTLDGRQLNTVTTTAAE